MINYVTIEKYEIDLSKADDFISAVRMLEDAGVDLKGFRVVNYLDTRKKIVMQRVKQTAVTKADLLVAANDRNRVIPPQYADAFRAKR
jgi:hypothetical protein